MSLGQLRNCLLLGRSSGIAFGSVARILPSKFEGRRNLTTDRSVYKKEGWPYKKKQFNYLYSMLDYTVSRLNENSIIICVEGPPGCGKTEIAETIAREFHLHHIPGPTEQNIFEENGFDIREMNDMFPNPKMRAYDMEMLFNEEDPRNGRLIHNTQKKYFVWKFKAYIDALRHVLHTGQGVVIENSVWADAVYADTLYKLGYTSRNAIRYYKDYKSTVLWGIWKPHLVLHIDGPTSYILEQMVKSNPSWEGAPGLNEKYVSLLKHNFTTSYLPFMSTYSEVLSFDVTDLPDMDLLSLDLEKMDFANIQVDKPARFDDWRKKKEEQFSVFRLAISRDKTIEKILHEEEIRDLPEEALTTAENIQFKAIRKTIPQLNYCRDFFYDKNGNKRNNKEVDRVLANSPMAPASTYGQMMHGRYWKNL